MRPTKLEAFINAKIREENPKGVNRTEFTIETAIWEYTSKFGKFTNADRRYIRENHLWGYVLEGKRYANQHKREILHFHAPRGVDHKKEMKKSVHQLLVKFYVKPQKRLLQKQNQSK